MPHVIQTKGGQIHTIFDVGDLLELVEIHAGYEVRRELEAYMRDCEALDKQNDALYLQMEKRDEHYHNVLTDVSDKVERIQKALEKERLSRKELQLLTEETARLLDSEL